MKKALVALLAIASCASMQAYKIEIDNKTKNKYGNATSFRIQFFSNNELARKPYLLKPDQDKSFKFKSKKLTITSIRVTGVDGLADKLLAFFEVPQGRLNKDLELDIDAAINGEEVDLFFGQEKDEDEEVEFEGVVVE